MTANWKKRWFVLHSDGSNCSLKYFEKEGEEKLKGEIELDPTNLLSTVKPATVDRIKAGRPRVNVATGGAQTTVRHRGTIMLLGGPQPHMRACRRDTIIPKKKSKKINARDRQLTVRTCTRL